LTTFFNFLPMLNLKLSLVDQQLVYIVILLVSVDKYGTNMENILGAVWNFIIENTFRNITKLCVSSSYPAKLSILSKFVGLPTDVDTLKSFSDLYYC
jgi:hypothetical protein